MVLTAIYATFGHQNPVPPTYRRTTPIGRVSYLYSQLQSMALLRNIPILEPAHHRPCLPHSASQQQNPGEGKRITLLP